MPKLAHFNLRAHLFQAGHERFDLLLVLRQLGLKLLLQFRNGGLLFFNFAMLLDEFGWRGGEI